MSTAEATTEATAGGTADVSGLFPAEAYELPIPKLDGHRADTLKITVGGAIELDLYDEHAIAFITGLKLGHEITVTVTARVATSGWQHTLKGEDQEDHVVYAVGLKTHSLELPETG